MDQSPVHRHAELAGITNHVLSSLRHGCYKLYRANDRPYGYVSWAFLSPDAAQIYREKGVIHPKDWKSGDQIWMVNFISPFGHTKEIYHHLRTELFPGKLGYSSRVKYDGSKHFRFLRGVQAEPRHPRA